MPKRRRLATCIIATLLPCTPALRVSAEPLSGPKLLRMTVPDAASMDAERLAGLSETIRTNYRSVRAVVVLRGDLPVFEYYRDGTDPNDVLPVMSVTKSVMSILVGIALGQGAFSSLDQRLGDLLPEALEPGIDSRVREITISHLLAMTSGFDPDRGLRAAPPPSALWKWSLYRPMLDAPGRRFNYDNQASHLLSIVLTRAIKQDPARFAHQYLFGPLGIEKYAWPLDSEGHLQGAAGLVSLRETWRRSGAFISGAGNGMGASSCPRCLLPHPRARKTQAALPSRRRTTAISGGLRDRQVRSAPTSLRGLEGN